MRVIPLLTLCLLVSASSRGAVIGCTEANLEGPFGFLLSGVTTIPGVETPVVSLSRIEFDGHGSVSGNSSVNFNGLLLGNPATGRYSMNSDCTLTLSLQDDSGAYQNFSGKLNRNENTVSLRQTDPGTGERGTMATTKDDCETTNFQGRWSFTLSGAFTPLAANGNSGPISASGTIDADGTGKFTLTIPTPKTAESSGTFSVESGCVIHLEFALPAIGRGPEIPLKLRGILVNDGKEIFAIETQPQTTVSVRMSRF